MADEKLVHERTQIPEMKDILVGELAERSDWVLANITTNSFWPVTPQKVNYNGDVIWIIPITHDYFPAIAMKTPAGKTREECERTLMQFLSVLSWVEAKGYLVDGLGGGSLPCPMGREKSYGLSICDEFDLSYFPEVIDERTRLALALMREGRGLNHPGYAFLSFYRVLEVALPKGKQRGKWVNDRVNTLTERNGRDAVAKLKAKGITEVGVHLMESGRRAIAHAQHDPVIDPDNPAHNRRLWSELPIMSALAQLAIEELLHLETSHTVWEKHLYELAGFKNIFGEELVAKILKGEDIEAGLMVDIPKINVTLRRRAAYSPLSNMVPVSLVQNGTNVMISFKSSDGFGNIRLTLAFAEERLEFNQFKDIYSVDDGSAEAADSMAEMSRFAKEHFGNGQLQIYNSDTGELIARKDAYIPLNMWQDGAAADAEIESIKRLAAERREKAC